MTVLDQNLSSVLRTTSRHIKKLAELEIRTVRDFLMYFPRRYEYQSETNILELKPGDKQVIKGVLSNFSSKKIRGMDILSALVTDNTGSLEVVWFNQPYLKQKLAPGDSVTLAGKVKFDFGKITMQNPSVELKGKDQVHSAEIIPIYSEKDIEGQNGRISSKWLREKLHPLMYMTEYLEDPYPNEIRERNELLPMKEAIKEVHFPTSEEKLEKAKERLAFDELLFLQISALQKKWAWRKGVEGFEKKIKLDKKLNKEFLNGLPFKLTGAQDRSLKEICGDLDMDYPMLRLLQGDVGSGKTVVAAAAALQAVKAGFQVAVMAPTSILTEQHCRSFKKMLEQFGIKVELILGSLPAKDKKERTTMLANGEIDIVIGTHAIIQDSITFKNLGLAIVDEQHRFGVKQREKLKEFGNPHLLNMSATPIPRTLALTIYGDQDISVIDELPPGRQEIMTRIVPEHKRSDAYTWIAEQIEEGKQAFVICPLVEESEKLENVKAATEEFERLKAHIFPNFKLGLLHGRLTSEEKDSIMKSFSANEIQILVSTSVVEVGIDVPNSTIMMIEGAERFGLSQLHQFRGRVGRGAHQSYCFLFPHHFTDENKQRLIAMVKHSSGFKLSEIDLELRGPGAVYGVRQSGVPDLRMATFSDGRIIKKARIEAEKLISEDPLLTNYPRLHRAIKESGTEAHLV
ncbi:MAG: ATP-dependent DNA helicase RecG [Candidatus Peregrinibacteria bacterium]|nr:ATP-dependent DNA helicase RecG [Candidatus Peregrinibacteria bacterium]MDZ4245074.1 ATP-dependent DNA helicase RecG [Candidatus Gracilibacteria bacterium]